jgi:hypothetical protein
MNELFNDKLLVINLYVNQVLIASETVNIDKASIYWITKMIKIFLKNEEYISQITEELLKPYFLIKSNDGGNLISFQKRIYDINLMVNNGTVVALLQDTDTHEFSSILNNAFINETKSEATDVSVQNSNINRLQEDSFDNTESISNYSLILSPFPYYSVSNSMNNSFIDSNKHCKGIKEEIKEFKI